MIRITLKGRIPSKKNSKVWTGRYIVSSKDFRKWESDMKKQLLAQGIKKERIDSELLITYKIWFPDNRRADISNKIESINDLLVDYGLLADDNHTIIRIMHCYSEGVDKENPRVEIQINLFSEI